MSDLLQEHIRNLPPTFSKVMHHYTTAPGAIGIVEKGVLRAGHISFLNDAHEYVLAGRLAIDVIRQFDAQKFYQNAPELRDAFISSISAAEDLERRPPIFVACFSEKENDLSQWRGYGGGEGGICLGFDLASLIHDENWRKGLYFLPCIYDPGAQRKYTERAMRIALSAYANLPMAKSPQLANLFAEELLYKQLSLAASLFKNPSFRDEGEWRILKWESNVNNYEFLAKGSIISGYINLDLKSPDYGNKLPLSKVWIGPSKLQAMTALSMKALLSKAQYQASINSSQIPYRVVA